MIKLYALAMLAFCLALSAMPGSAADFTLGIFGNANMDDNVDEKDVTYVMDVIKGTEETTELADANHDGNVDAKDILQIEQIINGSEKELVVKDDDGDAVIIQKPIDHVVTPGRSYDACEAMRSLNVADRLIGVSKEIQERFVFYPELSKLSGVGTAWEPDYEAIIKLNPDLVIISGRELPSSSRLAGYKEKLSGIMPVVYLALQLEGNYSERVKKLGYILDSEEAADDYIQWHYNIVDEIRSATESLPDEEIPRVFPTFFWDGTWNAYGGGYGSIPEMCAIAGGKNIGDVLSTSDHPEVDLEWIAVQDPEVIVVFPTSLCGYENSSDFISIRNSIVNTPLLSNVSAVKNNKVYVMCANCFEYSGSRIVMIAQMAKWYQPELFKDLNPTVMHQEYLDRIQKIDFNVSENKDLFILES